MGIQYDSVNNQVVFSGDTYVKRYGAGAVQLGNTSNGLIVSDHALFAAISTPATPSSSQGRLFANGTTADIYWLNSGGVAVSLTQSQTFSVLQGEPTGFPNRTDSTLSFNNTTREFTIAPAVTSFDVYSKGAKYTKSSAQTVTLTDVTGLHYVYFDASGVLQKATSAWDLGAGISPVATVYWNTDLDQGRIGEERHGLVMDWATHDYIHESIGSRYVNGLGGSFTNTTFTITDGVYRDEDIRHVPGQQTQCRVFRRDGSGNWTWGSKGTLYYVVQNTHLTYDNGGTLTETNSNEYVAVWFFVTNDPETPIYVIMGQRKDTTIADARNNNTYDQLVLTNLPAKEFKVLFRVILRDDASPYEESQDLRSLAVVSSGTYVATDHNSLTNRTVLGSHPASAITVDVGSFTGFLAGTASGQSAFATLDTHTHAPPSGDTRIIYNDTGAWAVSTIYQLKASGYTGIGQAAPGERLHLKDGSGNGAVVLGAHQNATAIAGTVEWTGTLLRWYDGSNWKNIGIDLTDPLLYKGVIPCAANPNYPAADAGHTYRISEAGKIGGASGPAVEVGDMIICTEDGTASGDHAAVGSKWDIIQANLDGAVIGPASATDTAVALFSGTTGKLIKNSLVTIDGSGSVNIPSSQSYKINGSALTYANVGAEPTLPLSTRGDLLYRNASNATARLPVGTSGQVITTDGTDVSWGAVPGRHDAVTLATSATTGGLGLSTQQITFQAATSSQNGYLTSTDWSTFSGKVSGAASSTDHALARWHETTGKILLNSNAILDDAGNLSLAGHLGVVGSQQSYATLNVQETGSGDGTSYYAAQIFPTLNATISGSFQALRVLAYTSGTPTVASYYGANIYASMGSVTSTNTYGVYISGFTVGTNKWDLYAADATAKNYFAGQLGVGISPSFQLHVSSTVGSTAYFINTDAATTIGGAAAVLNVRNSDATTNNFNAIVFNSSGVSAVGGLYMQNTDHASHYGRLLFVLRGADGWLSRMQVENDGKVGIGGAPQATLDVQATSAWIRAMGSTNPYISAQDTTNTCVVKMQALDSAAYLGTQSDHEVRFIVNNAAKAYLTTTGRLGINVAAPSYILHTSVDGRGDVQFDSHSASDDGTFLWLRRSGGTQASPAAVPSGHRLGNIAFAGYYDTSNSSWGAVIQSMAYGLWSATNRGACLQFYTTTTGTTALTERMRIIDNGYVGIGATTPDAKLQVNTWIENNTVGNTPTVLFWGNVPHSTSSETVLRLHRPVASGLSYGGGADFNIYRYGSGSVAPYTQMDIALKSASSYVQTATVNVISMRDTGNVGIGNTTPDVLLTLGTAGTKAGSLSLAGLTTGVVTVQVAADAGTWSLTLPTTAGTDGYFLKTNGSGVTSWAAQSTNSATFTAATETTDTTCFPVFVTTATGSVGAKTNSYLLYNSSTGLLTLGDSVAVKTGLLGFAGSTSGLVTVTVAAVAGTWSLTLPTSAGTSGYFLKTNGSGITSWDTVTTPPFVVPASDHSASGVTLSVTAGETVAIGDVCYLKSDGKFWKADADAQVTADGMLAMATAAISADATGVFLLQGLYRDDTWTWTVGGKLYVGATAGNPTQTAPSTTGQIQRIVGYALSADVAYFSPDTTFVELS